MLDRINGDIRSNSNLVQWKNTQQVLDWFNGISDKSKKCFVKFDIVDFYPSITSQGLSQAFKFARKYTKIPKKEERIVRHSCKTLLFHNNEPWVKKGSINSFDVPMGSYHGAELCELLGLYILDQIKDVFRVGHYGLYRDDGLAVIEAHSNLKYIEQEIQGIMERIGFGITIESGLVRTEFLDVFLDLKRNTYNPFKKPGSKLMYVNRQSNHPPNITRAIPNMVVQRIRRLSKNKSTFDNHSREYIDELTSSGYTVENTEYEQPVIPKRKRNILYYHPPFDRSVKTKFGRIFRDLVLKHFTPNHIFHKIFNKNTLKISYSRMPNMKSILEAHNRKLVDNIQPIDSAACNCRNKDECPLNGQCLVKNVIYKATVSTPTDADSSKVYIGSTSRSFKSRYNEHKASFKTERSEPSSKLSSHIRDLKKTGRDYKIQWQIVKKSKQTSPTIKFCLLCNLERREIAEAKRANLLNSRNELITKCAHNRNLFFMTSRKKPP